MTQILFEKNPPKIMSSFRKMCAFMRKKKINYKGWHINGCENGLCEYFIKYSNFRLKSFLTLVCDDIHIPKENSHHAQTTDHFIHLICLFPFSYLLMELS